MVPFIDDNIVAYVDFGGGTTFNHEAARKLERIKRERKIFPVPLKLPSAYQVKITTPVFFYERYTSNDPYKLWDMFLTALFTINSTPDKDLMTLQHVQKSTHKIYTDLIAVFSSLRLIDKKRKGLQVNFAFFTLCISNTV